MWRRYVNAASLEEVLQVLADQGERARIIAGGTDLLLEIERGLRKGLDTLVDVTRIPGLDGITKDRDGTVRLGPLVTHNDVVGSRLLREAAFPLVRAAWEVGSPQIRNRGTLAGNLVTASPANDTISPLMALGARVRLCSSRGERIVSLKDFYTGVRRTVMEPDEMLLEISFPALGAGQRGAYLKHALRRAQAISLLNIAAVLDLEGGVVRRVRLTLGAVAPVIVHAEAAEDFLLGRVLDDVTLTQAAELAAQAARPITDVRGSGDYRKTMVRVITRRVLEAIGRNREREGFPAEPVLLAGRPPGRPSVRPAQGNGAGFKGGLTPINTRVNGRGYEAAGGHHKTLLRFLREDLDLNGTKEGCAEGECGACTVFLDGKAVMSCLVPACRAQGAEIVTVEGLSRGEELHPVQQAFLEAGAVQCGYCTPGFLMSAAKLLEERPSPGQEEARQAITGNLCRCTGYYKILDAMERAAALQAARALPEREAGQAGQKTPAATAVRRA